MLPEPGCTCRLTDEGFHELTFHKVSRDGVDESIVHLERIFRQTARESTARIISDNPSNKLLPMSYAVMRARAMIKALPGRPTIRMAMVGNGMLAGLVDTIARS